MSSDDSCTAPEKFHLSSSNASNDDDDCSSRLSVFQVKCPLCYCCRPKTNFHCRDCIRNGDFLHSNQVNHYAHNFSNRFSEKQLKYINIKSTNYNLDEKIFHYLQKKRVVENLKTEIAHKKERISVIRKLVAERKNNLTSDNERKKHLTALNRGLRIKLPKYEDKVKELENYVTSKLEDIEKRRESYCEYEKELKQLVRESIQKLNKYIFPIKQTVGKLESNTTCEITDLERDLADATRNIGSRDRGGFISDSQNDIYYVIVAPFISANGDYSEYVQWVLNNKDAVPTSSSTATGTSSEIQANPNPAIRISAALTYTAQLVQVLSFYLDVRLPFKMVYSEFCSRTMTEQQITRRVARLNANILYLCYTQRIQLAQLHPAQTIENILKLFNPENKNVGRIGPVDPSDCNLSKNLEKQLLDELEFGDESDSEDENNFPTEWENVSHHILLSGSNSPTHQQSHPQQHHHLYHDVNQQPNLLNQQASMAGGLMTSAAASIASIWRGWRR